MKALPTLLSTAQLDTLLATMAALPSAQVNRTDGAVTVTATKRTTGQTVTVLSAAIKGEHWTVKAVPGLIIPRVVAA
jgi:hypothetical protein